MISLKLREISCQSSTSTPASTPPRLCRGLYLRRVPTAIGDHQAVPLRNRLPGVELVHLVEHEGEAGAGVGRLADEPFVGVAQVGGVVEEGER